jgi:hypothetical protein
MTNAGAANPIPLNSGAIGGIGINAGNCMNSPDICPVPCAPSIKEPVGIDCKPAGNGTNIFTSLK